VAIAIFINPSRSYVSFYVIWPTGFMGYYIKTNYLKRLRVLTIPCPWRERFTRQNSINSSWSNLEPLLGFQLSRWFFAELLHLPFSLQLSWKYIGGIMFNIIDFFKITFKRVHKIEIFFGSEFEFCTILLLVLLK